MKSAPSGTGTSRAEVTNVSVHGFWVLIDGHELFVPFAEFPWFRDATISQITTLEVLTPNPLSTGLPSTSISRWTPSRTRRGIPW